MPIPGTKYRDLRNASAPIGFDLLSARWLSKGAKRRPLVGKQNSARATWGSGLATLFARIFAGSPGRSVHPRHFCGSKAGATFRLAMISIGSGLKPAHRNAIATIVFRRLNGRWGRQIFWLAASPHHAVSGGRGDGERSHGLKLNYSARERAEVANHIYAQRTPLQISHEASSILDFIRPADVLIVVKMDRLGRNTRDVLNLVHELEEKEQASGCWSLPSTPPGHGPMGAGRGRRDGAWLHL